MTTKNSLTAEHGPGEKINGRWEKVLDFLQGQTFGVGLRSSQRELWQAVLHCLQEALGIDEGVVMLADEDRGQLVMQAVVGDIKPRSMNMDGGICGGVLVKGSPLINNDGGDGLTAGRAVWEPVPALYLPVRAGRDVRGVLCLGRSQSRHPFSPTEMKLGMVAVKQAALVLENFLLTQSAADLHFQIISSLTAAIDFKDKITRKHSTRVTAYAVKIGREMGLTEDFLEELYRGGLLHDVGKIGIRDSILGKEGSLDSEEWAAMRKHPEMGAAIVGQYGPLQSIVPIVLYHHERYDGRGYPAGLAGGDIPLGARIVAVADAFEAMTADRPYRRAMSTARAAAILKENAGSQFDPQVVAVFLRALEGEEFI